MASINKTDVQEIKRMNAPPQDIKDVLHGVMLLLGKDIKTAGDWGTIKKVLGEAELLKKLEQWETSKVPEANMAKAREIIGAFKRDELKQKNKIIVAFYDWGMKKLQ